MMYNRYIPQPDGTYMRRRIEEPAPPEPPRNAPQDPEPCKEESPSPPPPKPPKCEPKPPQKGGQDVGGFFAQLLPRGFDTGDLIVVLLLLLMAADCNEDQNSALLTLALYLFL